MGHTCHLCDLPILDDQPSVSDARGHSHHVRCIVITGSIDPIVDEAPMTILSVELRCDRCESVRAFDMREHPLVGSTQINIWRKNNVTPCAACGNKSLSIVLERSTAGDAARIAAGQTQSTH